MHPEPKPSSRPKQARRPALTADFKAAAFRSVGYGGLEVGLTDHEFRLLYQLAKRVAASRKERARGVGR